MISGSCSPVSGSGGDVYKRQVLMIVAFAICHKLFPEAVPFDYKVIIGGIIGTAVAVGNFFIMGLTVQKIASGEQSDEQARCV